MKSKTSTTCALGSMMAQRLLPLLALVSLSSPCWSNDPNGEFTKTVTWEFKQEPAATDKGSYTYKLKVYGKDVDVSVSPKALQNSAAVEWILQASLPLVALTQSTETAPHPEGEAEVDLSAMAPVFDNVRNVWSITGVVRGAVEIDKGSHKGPHASAFSRGKLRIKSGRVMGADLLDDEGKVKVRPRNNFYNGFAPLTVSTKNAGYFHDPVELELLEVETGTITTEQIFSFDMDLSGVAEVTWDDATGIMLDAPLDGTSSIAISGGFASSWITASPGMFSASLMGGQFSTSGALDGLPWQLTLSGVNVIRAELLAIDMPILDATYEVPTSLIVSTNSYDQSLVFSGEAEVSLSSYEPGDAYCTAGTSAGGCQAMVQAFGIPSASASTGFELVTLGVEGQKQGLYFFGSNGQQAQAWGSGTSFQCVIPPVMRTGMLTGSGTIGLCDGAFSQDLNARWTAQPAQNPGAGVVVQAQLWYRDPFNTSNQTTSFSDAIEFTVGL